MPHNGPYGEPALPLGVWKRARRDWAYRFEVDGYGSVYGCGFSTRGEARAGLRQKRAAIYAWLADHDASAHMTRSSEWPA